MGNVDQVPDIAPEKVRLLRRQEYDRMVEAGFFRDERLELLGGVLIETSPQDAPHAGAVDDIADLLRSALQGRARVRTHAPLALGDDSEPEPDIAVVPAGSYRQSHPTAAFLVAEVAHSSLRKDRGVKAAIYARAGIPEYWIVNLADACVEVLGRIVDGAYAERTAVGRGDTIRCSSFPDVEIAVNDILAG